MGLLNPAIILAHLTSLCIVGIEFRTMRLTGHVLALVF